MLLLLLLLPRQVWASQWAERAWLSRQACGVPEGQLSMSVLLQQVRGLLDWLLQAVNFKARHAGWCWLTGQVPEGQLSMSVLLQQLSDHHCQMQPGKLCSVVCRCMNGLNLSYASAMSPCEMCGGGPQ
jgi:hypothetical protein